MLNTTFLRVREDGVERLRAWLGALGSRRDDLRATYASEGTRHEQFFLLRDGEGPILVLVTELRDRREGGQTFLRSGLPLAVEFKELIQEISDGPMDCEKLYDSDPLRVGARGPAPEPPGPSDGPWEEPR